MRLHGLAHASREHRLLGAGFGDDRSNGCNRERHVAPVAVVTTPAATGTSPVVIATSAVPAVTNGVNGIANGAAHF